MADTPGNLLKTARETRKLNIAQASKGTRIRAFYIEAMEADDFSTLPSPVQARGFLRAYAEFLGLDASELLSAIELPQKIKEINNSEDSKSINDNLVSNEVFSKPLPVDQIQSPIISRSDIDRPYKKTLEEVGNDLKDPSIDQPILEFVPPKKSQLIYRSIGEKLKDQREALSLSLDEVEIHSHVRRHYLESIEAGDFEKLPSTVQARGMLTNYARFLEIDLDEVLSLFADALQSQRIERQPSNDGKKISTDPLKKISALQRYITIDLIFGGGLIVLLIVFAFWATGNVIHLYNSPASAATARSISDIILTPLQTMTLEGAGVPLPPLVLTNTPIINETPISTPGTGSGQVQVYVIVLQSAWMRVTVDGKIAFEGRVEPGSAFPFNGNNQVEILTGNGAALQIVYNQTDLGVLGVFGEVIDRIYTQNAIVEPTASITPSPTITPTPTRTPRLTSTPLPTRTPFYSTTP